jgi:hypothetical protein
VSFFLAMLAYAGLGLAVLFSAWGRVPRLVAAATAALVAAHVLLIWALRYEWQLSRATRNGYTGFLVFHTALSLILFSTFVHPGWAAPLLRLAFLAVTVGATGAVLRYEEVASYRLPVLLVGLVGAWGLIAALQRRNLAGSQ